MKKIIAIAVLLFVAHFVYADTIVSQLGDEDGFGSYQSPIDDMTRSEMIETLLSLNWGIIEMDIYQDNTDKGWTHYFTIPSGHTIVSANLRIGVVESGEHHWNTHYLYEMYRVDCSAVVLDPYLPGGWQVGPCVMLSNQPGYVRPAPMETVEFNIDLAAVILNSGWGDTARDEANPAIYTESVISSLYDGRFDIWGLSDCGVDYSILTIETIPEPCTVLFFALGGLALRFKRT